MIIELYSIPGAGKTTIIKSLTGGDATSFSGKRSINRLLIQTAKMMVLYTPVALSFKKQIKVSVKQHQYRRPVFIQRSFHQHLNSIVLVAWAYKRSNKGLIYMDEGLVHRIITLAVNYNLSDAELLSITDVFADILIKAKCYYLQVSVQECIKSIKRRNRHICEMDELNDVQLLHFLERYEHCCTVIMTHYCHPCITRDNYDIMRRE